MHPVQILMDEHQVILGVLEALAEKASRLGQDPFPKEFFVDALDFFRNFADLCHHFKEEDTLFPAMAAQGVPVNGGPIGVMLNDHEFGRARLREIAENLDAAAAGDSEAIEAVRTNALRYVQMLQSHIHKEDNILFRIAINVLDDAEVARLSRVFNDEENPRINAAVRSKYRLLAEKLTGQPVSA